ncbi:MAG: precorrin-6y C5,15-methyltransferase (decarboxylating) subunit CbiE [Candidatus Parabeggiatoa sp. nov. 1]|nr:MAG: precorrin-6y C5,15-methyltransferase (decarboxylating) subunit CbiE [Gammaproteobacteria bacterium]
MNTQPILIVSCGPGAPEYITEVARQAVSQAELLVGAARLLAMFPEGTAQRCSISANISAALDAIDTAYLHQKVVVLVTGDAGLHSFARSIIRRFGRTHCQIISGISSVQVAFARLGLEWTNAHIISAHGTTPYVIDESLATEERIAILGGGKASWTEIESIIEKCRATHIAFLCENLTLDNERVIALEEKRLSTLQPASLSIILLVSRVCLPFDVEV